MDNDSFHHIQRHILKVLTYAESARYRDIRPAGVDSNVFNYHRKSLVGAGYIGQNDNKTYKLTAKGMQYVEMSSVSTLKRRPMPKLTVTLVIKNSKGQIACWQKPVQPFIGTLMLPNGKVRFESESLQQEAVRVLMRLTKQVLTMTNCGVVEWSVYGHNAVITHTITHVFTADVPKNMELANIVWIDAAQEQNLAPGVQEIINFSNTKKAYGYAHNTIYKNT